MVAAARIDRDEALHLLRDEEFLALGRRADAERERRYPEGRVTFVVDRNINFTNVCTCQCRFCAFYRKPEDPDGYVLSTEQVLDKVQELVDRGGTQVLMQGGLNPALDLAWFEGLFRALKARFPEVQNHSLSPAEIVHIGQVSGLGMEQTLERLQAAGLDSVPGGGAEVLVDRVRQEISPNKIGWRQWTGVMEAAHRLGMPTTATLMFGATETDGDLVDHLLRVREVQDRTGGFTAFIPWTFQPKHTELGNTEGIGGTGAVRYLRVLALSRLVLDNVPSIQGSWVTQGEKVAQVALRFGANDLGGTMLEENVVAAAGVRFRLDQPRLIDLIADAGFRPAQRDTRYRILREFEGGIRPPEDKEDQRTSGGTSMASSTDTADKNRRRDERFARSVPLRVGHDSVDGVRAESINISTRGLYCKVSRYVQPFSKTKVCLELPFVAKDAEALECDGVVVRVEPDVEAPGIDEYRLAIYFLNLGHRQAALIEDFLAEAH